MSFKSIFIIVVTVLVTIVLMNNAEEIDFWFFGDTRVPKLVAMGSMFVIGFISGLLVRRKRSTGQNTGEVYKEDELATDSPGSLSEEDRDYIR